MEVLAKTLLCAYARLSSYLKTLDRTVEEKALTSAGFSSCAMSTEAQIAEIIAIINKKKKLLVLKERLEDLFRNFSREERNLLYRRFIRRIPFECFADQMAISRRTYFRHTDRLLDAFIRMLAEQGMEEEWFERELSSIPLFAISRDRVREDCERARKAVVKRKNNLKRHTSSHAVEGSIITDGVPVRERA